MKFNKTMTVKNEHIDFQEIMDGLYYPYYMEIVRHEFLKSIVKVDIVKEAQDNGLNYVLSSIEKMNFKRPVRENDSMNITCELLPFDKRKFSFYQEIIVNGKVVCDATFTATCIPQNGGRSFIPDIILDYLHEQ